MRYAPCYSTAAAVLLAVVLAPTTAGQYFGDGGDGSMFGGVDEGAMFNSDRRDRFEGDRYRRRAPRDRYGRFGSQNRPASNLRGYRGLGRGGYGYDRRGYGNYGYDTYGYDGSGDLGYSYGAGVSTSLGGTTAGAAATGVTGDYYGSYYTSPW
jgi:hypothetical protein